MISGSLLADRRPRAARSGVMAMDRSGRQLGHCDWATDDGLGGLAALEGCPNTSPTVVLNQDSIPPWILYAVAGWMLWMAFKK